MSSITGIFSNNDKVIESEDIADLVYFSNVYQKNRGQGGAGFVFANPKRIKYQNDNKDRGPVETATPLEKMRGMSDHTVFAALGHTCKSRHDFLKREDIHPIRIDSREYELYAVCDGFDLRREERIRELKERGYRFESETNGASIGTAFSRRLDETGDFFEAGEMLLDETDREAGYSGVFLARKKSNGKTSVVSVKDKRAIKPMCFGEANDTLFVESETYPLLDFGVNPIKNVNGGDVIVFSHNGTDIRKYGSPLLERSCIFENIYFKDPDSFVLEGLGPMFPELARRLGISTETGYQTVSSVRNCLGLSSYEFWEDDLPNPDLIMPVPDSGRGFTIGLAKGYNRTQSDGLVKALHYKSFLTSNKDTRKLHVRIKLKGILDKMFDKIIVGGEDSIVKGGVGGISQADYVRDSVFFPERYHGLINQLKNLFNVKEFHFFISYAPMFFPCYEEFGTMEKRAAEEFMGLPFRDVCEGVAKKLEPDWKDRRMLRVYYNPLSNIQSVCGDGYCTACADGRYPVKEELIPDVLKKREEAFRRAYL